MIAVIRLVFFCAGGLLLTSIVPVKASTGAETITLSPLLGRAGQTVTVSGTGWQEHGSRGIDVPIWIGFANQVASGHPDVNGKFSVSFTIPSSSPEGDLQISAIIGNGGSADAYYFVSATGCVDAYFIGLHGVLEPPDSSDINFGLKPSPEIYETGQNVKALKPTNKTVVLDFLDYHASTLAISNPIEVANTANIEREAVKVLNSKVNEVRGYCPNMYFVLVGYSFGAWVIDDWLAQQWSAQTPAWNRIRGVELYGDPLWFRLNGTYQGIMRRLGQAPVPAQPGTDPYKNTPPGYNNSPLADRWQSLCLPNDPICGEGYTGDAALVAQVAVAADCIRSFCEHLKYALSPGGRQPGSGYGLTKGGGEFMASKAFQ